ILAVIAIFKLIADRQVAALCAGSLFVLVPLLMMIAEYRAQKLQNWVWLLCALQFWVFFALPIFGMRILNWGTAFNELSFLGISGPTMHELSNKSFMVMLIATAWFLVKTFIPSKYQIK